MDKKQKRLRRSRRARAKIRELAVNRLTIHKTPRHIYAQVIAPNGSEVIVSANTAQSVIKAEVSYTGNCDAAKLVGKIIAEKAKEAGITKVAFDRSGFKYHGRVKSLADSARENGLEF